jgi:hypothetical protein
MDESPPPSRDPLPVVIYSPVVGLQVGILELQVFGKPNYF